MKTNKGLVNYAKEQVGNPYWYGTYGQTSNRALYNSKRRQYPNYYTASDFSRQYGKRVHDCIGIIKGYLWSDTNNSKPKYNPKQDVGACSMYRLCKEKGTYKTMPHIDGLLVFKGNSPSDIHHVGVYSTDGYVYEAKGHYYGTVKTKYRKGEWKYWAKCLWIDYIDEDEKEKKEEKREEKKELKLDYAQKFYKSFAGTYTCVASELNLRCGAGIHKDIITTIKRGEKVQCYGYYSVYNRSKWLYIVYKKGNKSYTGFASMNYLKK